MSEPKRHYVREKVDVNYVRSIIGDDMKREELGFRLKISSNTAAAFLDGRGTPRTIDRFVEVFDADYDKLVVREVAGPEKKVEDVPAAESNPEGITASSDDINLLISKVAELQETVSTFNDQMKKIDDALTMIGRMMVEDTEQARKFYINTTKFFTEYKNNKKYGTW